MWHNSDLLIQLGSTFEKVMIEWLSLIYGDNMSPSSLKLSDILIDLLEGMAGRSCFYKMRLTRAHLLSNKISCCKLLQSDCRFFACLSLGENAKIRGQKKAGRLATRFNPRGTPNWHRLKLLISAWLCDIN